MSATETEHKIEESVQVYLILRDGKWVIDGPSLDSHSLFPVIDGGARNEDCECDDHTSCEQARKKAEELSLPSGQELLILLAEAIVEHSEAAIAAGLHLSHARQK